MQGSHFNMNMVYAAHTQCKPVLQYSCTVFSQLNAPCVYFKLGLMDPAFIRSRRLIGARRLSKRCFFFCQQSWSRRDDFSLHSVWQTSLGLLLVTHHSIQHAYYCMLQSRCVKKSVNNTCTILRQGNIQSFKFVSEHYNINLFAQPQINAAGDPDQMTPAFI